MRTLANETRSGLTTPELARALGLVASPSPLVSIDRNRVSQIAEHLREREDFRDFSPAAWDDDLFWNVSDPPVLRSQFFAVGNAINFRFWTLHGGRVRPAAGVISGERFRGALYMWRCLRRALDHGGRSILDADWLAGLSRSEFDELFSDDTGQNPLAVAADERIENLRDLGRRLVTTWDGWFFNVVEATDGSLVEFASLCRLFRAFDDPLYKLTMVNAIVHSGSGTYEFRDEPLPAIDYHLLKQAIRQGMITPDRFLSAKLEEGALLDLSESIALRRAALLAFVDLASESGLSGEVLDNKYWLNRNVCADPVPACQECPFVLPCARQTTVQMPLELTRYY
jgi:Queuosine salvage protein